MPEHTPRTRHTVNERGEVVSFKRDKSEREKLERMLWNRIIEAGFPEPERQYYWARPERMFRSDFAYPSEHILLEVQGGIWARDPGRHNRGSGYQDDCARSNLAAILGWKLLAFTEKMIRDGTAIDTIKRALAPAQQPEKQLGLLA